MMGQAEHGAERKLSLLQGVFLKYHPNLWEGKNLSTVIILYFFNHK
jgi:hypothetical protein